MAISFKAIPLCPDEISNNCRTIFVERNPDGNFQSWKLKSASERLWAPVQNPSGTEFEEHIASQLASYQSLCKLPTPDAQGNPTLFVCKKSSVEKPALPKPADKQPPPKIADAGLPHVEPPQPDAAKTNVVPPDAGTPDAERLQPDADRLDASVPATIPIVKKESPSIPDTDFQPLTELIAELRSEVKELIGGTVIAGLFALGGSLFLIRRLNKLTAENVGLKTKVAALEARPRRVSPSPPAGTAAQLFTQSQLTVDAATVRRSALAKHFTSRSPFTTPAEEQTYMEGIARIWSDYPDLQARYSLQNGLLPFRFLEMADYIVRLDQTAPRALVLDRDEVPLFRDALARELSIRAASAGNQLARPIEQARDGAQTTKATPQSLTAGEAPAVQTAPVANTGADSQTPAPLPPAAGSWQPDPDSEAEFLAPAPEGTGEEPETKSEGLSPDEINKAIQAMALMELGEEDTIEIPREEVEEVLRQAAASGQPIPLTKVKHLAPERLIPEIKKVLARSFPQAKPEQLAKLAEKFCDTANKNPHLYTQHPIVEGKLSSEFIRAVFATSRGEMCLRPEAIRDPEGGFTLVRTFFDIDLAEATPKFRETVCILIEGGRQALEPIGGFAPLFGVFGFKTTAEHFGLLRSQESRLVDVMATSAFFIADAGFAATLLPGTIGAVVGHQTASRLAKKVGEKTGIPHLGDGELGNKLTGLGGAFAGFGTAVWIANQFESFRNFHAATAEGTKELARNIIAGAGAGGMMIEAGIAAVGEAVIASAAATTGVVVGEGVALGAWIHYSGAGKIIGTDQLGESIVDDWMKTFNVR